MNKILIAGCTLLTAFVAVAMPNKKELAKAQRLVDDVTSADLKALKAGTTTAKDVAGTHMQLAGKAESQAEKYLLYQGAFKLYARSEEYDLAADALRALNNEVKDVPPEVIVEVVGKEMRRVAGKKAPRVLTIFKQAKRSAKYREEIVGVEKALKAKPHDTELNRQYGECLAEFGRWDEAVLAFAKSAGEVAKIAAGEIGGKLPPQRCADFWWEYVKDDEITSYKIHAVRLYKTALHARSLDGLEKERAVNRVVSTESDELVAIVPQGVEELQGNINGPARIFTTGNNGRIILLKCPAGKYVMGYDKESVAGHARRHEVTISRDFWLGKYPVTVSIWNDIMDDHIAGDDNDTVGCKSWFEWNKFLNKLNQKYERMLPKGYVFRCPTEAEWEYAAKSGGRFPEERYAQDNLRLNGEMQSALKNNGLSEKIYSPHRVGLIEGNIWGFYDLLGNSRQFMLDTFSLDPVNEMQPGKDATHIMYEDGARDPFNRATNAPVRLQRGSVGGSMSAKSIVAFDQVKEDQTLRLCLGPDLEKEWNDKHKNQK